MRRRTIAFSAIAATAVLFGATACGSDSGDAKAGGSLDGRTLNVTTYGGAWKDASTKYLLDPFAKETGVKITQRLANTTSAAQIAIEEKTGNVQTDLGLTTSAPTLDVDGYVEHFPADLMSVIKQTSRPGTYTDYGLKMGATVNYIACNSEIVKKCPTNAQEFWDVKDYPGDRAIAASEQPAMSFALLADGVSKDQLFPMDVDRAINSLDKIKSHIKVWPTGAEQQEQIMRDKEVGISYMWSEVSARLKPDMPGLETTYVDSTMPDGSSLAVPKGAPNKDVAFAFIKWVAEHPKAQAKWAQALGYDVPSKEATNFIPKDVLPNLPSAHTDEIVVVDAEQVAKQIDEIDKAWQAFISH